MHSLIQTLMNVIVIMVIAIRTVSMLIVAITVNVIPVDIY